MTRYGDAGVDVPGGDAVKARIAERVRATWGPGVRILPRGFAGVMAWPSGAPLLAATMDGVGTKLHVAMAAGRVDDATADLVYHCANDLLVHGATPLCFFDYIAQARLEPAVVAHAVEGMARACAEVGAALLGGETAQMPDTYLPGVIDVAGCMIGWLPADRLLDGSRVVAGDVVLGLGSDGLHTNGYSLARRVLADAQLGLDDPLPGGGTTIGAALLAPHRWYGPALAPRLGDPALHALAHVTGGGIAGNLVRVLPDGCRAMLDASAWPRPAVFEWIARAGGVPESDLRTTFNLGIGMTVVAAVDAAATLVEAFAAAGERVWTIGRIEAGPRDVVWEDGGIAPP